MIQRKAVCTDIIQETPTVKTFVYSIEPAFDFVPGQFVSLMVTLDGKLYRRPYSIASVPRDASVALTIKLYPGGAVTPHLFSLDVGHEFPLIGPFGRFALDGSSDDVLLIGAGSGIVPLMSMLRTNALSDAPRKMTLLFSNKTRDEIIYADELNRMADEYSWFTFIPTLTQEEWDGHVGRIDAALVSKHVATRCYICGPPMFCAEQHKHAVDAGIKHVMLEQYD